jgi:hypothetical protein
MLELAGLDAGAVNADFLNAPVPPGRSLPDFDVAGPERFINRELSWLSFNWRVMAEAESPAVPLLERVRFLSISASNLDEFYSVRVAGLRGLVREGVHTPSADGLSPTEQLHRIDADARALMIRQQEALVVLDQAMRAEGIEILRPADLKGADLRLMETHFFEQVFPILSPLAVDPPPSAALTRCTARTAYSTARPARLIRLRVSATSPTPATGASPWTAPPSHSKTAKSSFAAASGPTTST